MDKIIPLDYITDTDPVPITARDATQWYESVYIAIHTETTRDNNLVWLLAQGWVVWQIQIHNISNPDEKYYTWYLTRRVISGEKVLAAMVTDYTAAYNEGRDLNDERYDDIVTIYSLVADKMQDELVLLDAKDAAYDALIEALITNISADWTAHDTEVSGDLDDWGTAQTARINTQFDAESSKAQSDLISRGLNNTTVWTSVSAGVERERARALNEHNDRLIVQQLALEERLYAAKTQMRDRIVQARERLFSAVHTAAMAREDMREKIITVLCHFMERRTDSYPDLTAIGNAAAELGAGAPVTGMSP
jgi:hypothetical protein